ncbi:EscV/YscV/HrcV family type III secretion system export apparatus protein [Candidatus Saganbacteria bacterium CG08_land_8_20_14_0_20_45_16]|uniref:EscV/YscV/HrcV family type III secretion system export apparatus protein n=1 Tax=Candidatus Saganbacteria bacterium CG08_land_8_20_14_0_20_45_16 TaxID=2014293 RepID=A0A2H0XWU6_UNCSA|nr:MAG: EscV/YscV/HrcV family type III secretion system export apparatus protein [Candidatus Saganbacteria bacterium CG08_land_8_20_14_0_20_45_16]
MATPGLNLEGFKKLFSVNDFLVALLLVVIIGLMIVPLPPFVLDLLMTVSIAFALIILLVAMFLKEPLEFASFPSILLIITVFRLSLNIAASRLILNQGFAGDVITAFGTFVVGGNYVVGAIIFIIITIVNFIVITKGSERVAEVAARFTLDAMPGKQMSIDADLNAGLIDANEARARRRKIEREATFYGSMDGANKFVRGDSIAGIIIVLVNIIGGILVGWLQAGLGVMEALTLYALLTIGAGLIGQLTALLISIATGLVITKSATEMSLGTDVASQVFAQPRAFAFVCIIMGIFAMIPGIPTTPFMILASLSGGVALVLMRSQSALDQAKVVTEEVTAKDVLKKPESILGTLGLDPLSLKAGRNLIPLIDPSQKGPLLERITLIRYNIGQELGFVIPGVRVMDDLSLPPDQYTIEIRGTKIAQGEIKTGHHLVELPLAQIKAKKLSGIGGKHPLTGDLVTWVPDDALPTLQKLGIASKPPVDIISEHFSEIIKRHADEIMTRQNVQSLIELVKNNNAAIVRELIPDLLSLGQVHKVMQLLVRERVSIRDLSTILEKLADYAHLSRDINVLAEYVRQSLARQICDKYTNKDGVITVVTIDPALEETLIGSIHQSEYGSFLAADPNVGEKILVQISGHLRNFRRMKLSPVILCSPRLRPHFKRFIERSFPDTSVLSYNEIVPQVKVQSIGMISAEGK